MMSSLRFDPDSTHYPAVRRVMGAQRMRFDDAQLEDLIESMFPESDAGDVENFMRSLQSLGHQAAPLAQLALPGVLKGAASGASVAGPWGAIVGGLGGGAASLLSPATQPRPAGATAPRSLASFRPVAPASDPSPPTAPALPPDSGAAAARPQAAAQLLALLSRPETMQALLSLLMAGVGKPAVVVGPHAVPAQAFAGAIAELASEAAAAWSGPARDDLSDYLLDDAGDPRGDIYNPAARAALLLADLADVADGEGIDHHEPLHQYAGADFEADSSGGDPIDSYEAALNGRSSHDD